ncbi:hypothetical protein BDZ89DRAFT_1154701 [Hymenopellis radicata]|nr:hypothetical protein BDZ89DRAFT_1154701 [Hymenopellis radicata]
MSSLAGALIPPRSLTSPIKSETAMDAETGDHEQPDEGMADLFGNEEEEQEEDAASASGHDSERIPSPEREYRKQLEYAEEELPQDLPLEELTEAVVDFPNIPVPQSSDGNKWVMRMPNFVKLDPKPFHPDTYMGPEHDEEENQQAEALREQSMTIKLKVENTVRWRWKKDEHKNDVRETNSRIIRWSDGSLSLRLGKELFDIKESIDTAGGVHRQSLGGSQLAQSTPTSHTPGGKTQGLTYLVAQHKTSQVLQAEALVTGYLSLRPTGMQSETHRMLVKAVGQRHNKVARLRLAPDPTMDPEREVNEAIKKAKRSAPRRSPGDGLGHKRRRQSRSKYDSDDDGFGADSDEEEGGRPRKSRHTTRARKDEDGKADYQADDFVVSMKKRIVTMTQARRASGSGGGGGAVTAADNDEAMDVESEEEDDEPKVRRAGSSRRKRAMYDDAEEEEE